MMRKTIGKKALCITLSIIMAVTSFYCNQETVFAAEMTEENFSGIVEESSISHENEAGDFKGLVSEESDLPEEEIENTDSESDMPAQEEEVPAEAEEPKDTEDIISEDSDMPEEEIPVSEEEIPEEGMLEEIPPVIEEPMEIEEPKEIEEPEEVEEPKDKKEEKLVSEKSKSVPKENVVEAEESNATSIPADHTLAVVYWNPKAQSETSPDGQTVLQAGNDSNTGASARVPVQTLETALLRASSDAVIYCMGYLGKYENYSADGDYYNATIKRYTGHTGNILQITNGTMKLSNLTLDGSDNIQSAVIAVTTGGELVLGESVNNIGDTRYLVESEGKPIRLSGRPERDTTYHIQFASGYLNHAISDPDTGEAEIMLVNASEAGLDPTNYVQIEDLPEGWEVYTKDNRQIWARRIIPYTAIFLNGITGNDSNDGRSNKRAVKTYERAWELYQSKLNGTGIIYISGTVKITGSVNIENAVIGRYSYKNELFEVTNTGSLTIGNNVTIQDNPNEFDAIKSGGELRVNASSATGRLFLTNRQKPLILEGTGGIKYPIRVERDFEAGDLVVSNAAIEQGEVIDGRYILNQQGQNLYLSYPPCVYLNSRNGEDYYGGEAPEYAVKSLQKALELALLEGKTKILVLEVPTQIRSGDDVTIPEGISVEQYNTYGGDLINVSGGLLNVNGSVSSSALSSTAIVIGGTGRVVAGGNVSAGIGGAAVKESGVLIINRAGFDKIVTLSASGNPTVIHNDGTLHHGAVVNGGTYTLNNGNITDVSVAGAGVFDMKGGSIRYAKKNALTVENGGTVKMSGGVIEQFKNLAVVIKDGDVTLSGGSILGNPAQVKRAIKVNGNLHIAGDVNIQHAIISLENNTHPLLLEAALPAGRVYQMDVGYSYVAPRETKILVQGAAASPAMIEHFQMAEDASAQLSVANDNNAHSVVITKAGDPEGIYLDGTHGNDANTGEDSVRAVATFAKAKELLRQSHENNGKEYNIYISGNVTVAGNETWSLPEGEFPWHPMVKRYEHWKDDLSSPIFIRTSAYGMVHVDGTLTLENITLDGNRDVESRFSIIHTHGTLNVNEGAVITRNNRVSPTVGGFIGGGAITTNADRSHIILNGGSICDNYNDNGSGGVWGKGSFTMNSGSIENNVTNDSRYAGGISMDYTFSFGGEIIINGGSISHNKTIGLGGGIQVAGPSNFEINGGTISHNEAQQGGGIFYDSRGTLKIMGGEISHNKAQENGGGIGSTKYTWGGDMVFEAEITGGIISNNEAGDKGGGIYWKEGNLLLDGVEISGNQANLGGGAYIEELLEEDTFLFELKNGEIFENTASSKGGGIFWAADRKSNFSGGTIRNNQAPDGEGMYMGRDSATFGVYPRDFGPAIFGKSQIQQNIKLGDSTVQNKLLPLRLVGAPTDPDNHFNLAVAGSAYAQNGTVVVEPDGDNVINAAQYLKYFSINDNSGYTLVKNGNNIIIGQAYFVDGVNGSDSNNGSNPDMAFKTVSHAISALGNRAGAIYICGTVSVPSLGTAGAASQVTWTLGNNQSIIRYSGEMIGGRAYDSFTADMIEVKDGAELSLNNVSIYGALGEESMEGNGYIMVQGGILNISPTTKMEYGTVYLKDGKEIAVTGNASGLLMEIEKENARQGDVIGHYVNAGASFAKEENFRLSEEMSSFSLHKRDADTVVLGIVGKVYVDGQNGDDGNDGLTPATSFLTMKKAYQTLQNTGGQIHIVDTVEISTDTELGILRYADTADNIAMTGRVQILRYERNQNPLFLISNHTTVFSGIRLDGSGAAAVGNTSPLIKVGSGGTLKIKDHAVLTSNHSTGNGGAIENEGKTELYQCSFRQNQAAKGAAVYQNGTLLVNSREIKWSELGQEAEEIYLCPGKYIDIGQNLAADTNLQVNMDSSDTAEGRVIAEFAADAYEEEVIREAEHFKINPAATRRKLDASGSSTLVLAGDFGVSLTGAEFFQKVGSSISFNGIVANANPENVALEVTKNGHNISVDTRDYNRYKKIKIQVSPETIGELLLSFTYNGEVIQKNIIISGYEVIYANGQDSLIAEAQKDNVTGMHTDTANIRIYNGASVPKTFQADERSIRFHDRALVEIDNNRVSRDMEPSLAMRYFGLDLETLQIPANGTKDAAAILSNGDLLTADKKGEITLDNASLGGCSSNIELDYKTKSTVRVEVQVRKDSAAVNDAALSLKDASGNMTSMVYRPAQVQYQAEYMNFMRGLPAQETRRQGAFPYCVTGIAPGTYRIYMDGVDTGKSVTASAGIPAQENIDLYTIKYELKGGKLESTAPKYYISGMGLDALPQPSYAGHTFGGWYRNNTYTGNVTAGISKQAAEPYVLYAKWEKEQVKEEPEFDVRLQQDKFFEQLGSVIEIKGQLLNASAKDVKVKAEKLDKNGKVLEAASAEYTDSKGVKTIAILLDKDTIGTLLLTFQTKTQKVQKKVELSGYEVLYKAGKDSLIAKPQKDDAADIHKDTADITIYNGSFKEQEFSLGASDIRYADLSWVSIDHEKVSKDMSADKAMKYFGLEVKDFQSIEAGGKKTVKLILFNGDLLTADKKGTILFTDTALGVCKTDIEVAYETQAITRVQIAVKKDDVPVNNGKVVLQSKNGKIVTLAHKDSSKNDGVYWNTGLSTGIYTIYANDVDTSRQIQVERGKVGKKSVNFYTIKYELNKGKENEPLPKYYVQGNKTVLAEPVRKGYTFEGWFQTKKFSGEAMKEISQKASGSVKLYAKWKKELKMEAPAPAPTPTKTPPSGPLPKTGDGSIIAIDVALMGGMGYLMYLFGGGRKSGISEEKKNKILQKIIENAKGKNLLFRAGAVGMIFVILAFYYTVGMNEEFRTVKKLQHGLMKCRKQI